MMRGSGCLEGGGVNFTCWFEGIGSWEGGRERIGLVVSAFPAAFHFA